MIYGRRSMELRDLVQAILDGDLLTARQWVADAHRSALTWETVPYPKDFSARELTVAAGLVELLARRAGGSGARIGARHQIEPWVEYDEVGYSSDTVSP